MKKILVVLFAVATLAMIASANLVDTGISTTPGGDDNLNHLNSGLGWYTGETATWDLSGGNYVRNTTGGINLSGFGQVADTTGLTSGDTTLEIDYLWIDADDDDSFTVSFYGYTHIGGSTAWGGSDAWHLNVGGAPEGSARYDVDALVTYDTSVAEGSGTLQYNVGDLTGYDYIAVRVAASWGAGDTASVSRIEGVPEPATIGVLGLGGLLAMLLRRFFCA